VITEADFMAAGVAPYDYIGVEVSAGGALLAANLAVAGMRVLPLEAGIEGGQTAVRRVNSCGMGLCTGPREAQWLHVSGYLGRVSTASHQETRQ
jgi:choline dehydrogenase-like flavoprotein